MSAAITDPNRSKIMYALIEVVMSNPNGDPDTGLPRQTSDGRGYITDTCLKRIVRDTAKDFHGVELYIEREGIKSERQARFKTIEDFVAHYWDARTMGGTPTGFRRNKHLGHGPFGCTLPTSLHPVEIVEMVGTCVAGEKKLPSEEDPDPEGLRGNLMRRAVVRYGLYLTEITYTAKRGMRVDVSENDIAIWLDSFFQGFEQNRAAGRSHMVLKGMWAFTHPDARFSVAKEVLRATLRIDSDKEDPSSFEDYTIEFDPSRLPQSIHVDVFDSTTVSYPVA